MQVCEQPLQRHLMGSISEQEDESVASGWLRLRERGGCFGEVCHMSLWRGHLYYV